MLIFDRKIKKENYHLLVFKMYLLSYNYLFYSYHSMKKFIFSDIVAT